MNLSELRGWLVAQGFRIASNPVRARDNECHWYAYRRSELKARECQCNERKAAQIVIEPHAYTYADKTHESVEVNLRGEYEVWWSLTAYGLNASEVPERLTSIEASLIRAWNALEA